MPTQQHHEDEQYEYEDDQGEYYDDENYVDEEAVDPKQNQTRRAAVGDDDDADEGDPQRQAAVTLKCLNCLIFLFGGGLAGVGYWSGTLAYGGSWTAYAVIAVGAAVVLVSCLGCCGAFANSVRLLMLYYTTILFATIVALVAGGFCFILTDQAIQFVTQNWDQISVATGTTQDSTQAANLVGLALRITGAVAFFVAFLLCFAMRSVVRLVSPSRAYSLMLQASNMTLLPVGFLLLFAALYVADTAASIQAPVTAFAIFILGMAVIVLSLLGCFGTAIGSRGIVRLFMWLVALLMLAFFAFGIFAIVQADTLQAQILNNWDTIRRVLPPTFSGKYDKEQFASFLQSNLLAVGFLSLVIGVLMFAQACGSHRLRAALKKEAEEDLYDTDAAIQVSINPKNAYSNVACAQRVWKRNWTHGSKRSRCCIRCGCSCLCFLLILIIGGSSVALYYSTSCEQWSKYQDTKNFAAPTPAVALHATMYNNYTRGGSHVAISSTATATSFTFLKSAIQQQYATTVDPRTAVDGATFIMEANPMAPFRVAGFDLSCQHADMTAVVPPASFFGGDSFSKSLVSPKIHMDTKSDYANNELNVPDTAPRFQQVFMRTTAGSVTVTNAKIGVGGAYLASTSGDVLVSGTDFQCDPTSPGTMDSGVQGVSQLGGVQLETSTLTDCDVRLVGGAALVAVTQTTSKLSTGVGSLISLTGEKGLLQLDTVTADQYDLKTTDGGVRVIDTSVVTNLKVSSVTGNIAITGLAVALQGNVQIETTSGSVTIRISKFAGLISAHTSGIITLVPGTTAPQYSNVDTASEENTNNLSASVNCQSQKNCGYLGAIIITSSTGDVLIEVDEWDQKS